MLTRLVGEDTLIMAHMYHKDMVRQSCLRVSERTGQTINTTTGIFDLKAFRMPGRSVLGMFKITSSIDAEYYPESVHRLYVINAPWVFVGFWKIAQRFVDPVTKSKVRRRWRWRWGESGCVWMYLSVRGWV